MLTKTNLPMELQTLIPQLNQRYNPQTILHFTQQLLRYHMQSISPAIPPTYELQLEADFPVHDDGSIMIFNDNGPYKYATFTGQLYHIEDGTPVDELSEPLEVTVKLCKQFLDAYGVPKPGDPEVVSSEEQGDFVIYTNEARPKIMDKLYIDIDGTVSFKIFYKRSTFTRKQISGFKSCVALSAPGMRPIFSESVSVKTRKKSETPPSDENNKKRKSPSDNSESNKRAKKSPSVHVSSSNQHNRIKSSSSSSSFNRQGLTPLAVPSVAAVSNVATTVAVTSAVASFDPAEASQMQRSYSIPNGVGDYANALDTSSLIPDFEELIDSPMTGNRLKFDFQLQETQHAGFSTIFGSSSIDMGVLMILPGETREAHLSRMNALINMQDLLQ